MIRRPLIAGALFASALAMSACGGTTATPTESDATQPAAQQTSAAPTSEAPTSAEPTSGPFVDAPAYTGDQAAEYDVSALAYFIAVWYVDHTGALPPITVEDGQYVFDGTTLGPVSSDVELGGATGTSDSDWCVWVTNPLGEVKDFHYAAEGSYEPGPC